VNLRKRAPRIHPSDAVAALLLVATFAVAVVTYGTVPDAMQIHYTPPGGVYYGPETVPKALGLFAVPVAATAAFLVARSLPAIWVPEEASPADLAWYRVAVVLFVAVMAGVQTVLVLLNVL